MTQKQFNSDFRYTFPDWAVRTLTDRRLLYNDYMQECYSYGTITAKQVTSWGHPPFLEAKKHLIDCNKYKS